MLIPHGTVLLEFQRHYSISKFSFKMI